MYRFVIAGGRVELPCQGNEPRLVPIQVSCVIYIKSFPIHRQYNFLFP